jgi:farnesyl diphosphate synthase
LVFGKLLGNCCRYSSALNILELFHESCFETKLGMLIIDIITAGEDSEKLNNINFAEYYPIILSKMAFYHFYLPVAFTICLAGIGTRKNLEQAKTVLLELGEYFQVRDNYLDGYGDPAMVRVNCPLHKECQEECGICMQFSVRAYYRGYEARALKSIRAGIERVDESEGFKKSVLTIFLDNISGDLG